MLHLTRHAVGTSHRVEAPGECARQLIRAACDAHPRQVVRRLAHEILRVAATRTIPTIAPPAAATRTIAIPIANHIASATGGVACGERRTEHALVVGDGEMVEAKVL